MATGTKDDLDDDLSDLIGGTPKPATKLPENFKPIEARLFTDLVSNAAALANSHSRPMQNRAGQRQSTQARKNAKRIEEQRERDAQVETFKTEHVAVYKWIMESASTFEFARNMQEALWRYGSLTEKQLAACLRCIEGRERARTEQAQRAANAPTIEITKIEQAFDTAKQHNLKWLHLRLDTFEFKPAGPASKNVGSIYVTEGGDYLGRITGGKFICTRQCDNDRQSRVLAAAANPLAAAKAYGLRTGSCSCCGRELTNAESIDLGIGPICAEKYGWGA